MPVLPAVLLVVFAALWYLLKTSTKLSPTVTFAKPTTVIPAGTAVFAAVAVIAVVVITARTELSPLWVLGLGAFVGFLILAMGGTTAGNRVVYDRGGRRLSPGTLLGVALVAVLCLMALVS